LSRVVFRGRIFKPPVFRYSFKIKRRLENFVRRHSRELRAESFTQSISLKTCTNEKTLFQLQTFSITITTPLSYNQQLYLQHPYSQQLHQITIQMATYSRSASSNPAKSLTETALPPRTLARVAREVRDLMKNAPEGTKLIVDPETGMPTSLSELVVSKFRILIQFKLHLITLDCLSC
jgi:hypothetical protein